MARTAYVKELTKNLGRGTTTLEVRPQTGKQDAAAFTVRTMLDYTTAPFDGFSASVQLIDVAHAGKAYNSLRNGDGQQRQLTSYLKATVGYADYHAEGFGLITRAA